MANRYIEGKADEYSSKRAWSSIGEQYPEGLTRGVNPGTQAIQAGANRVQIEGKGLIQYTFTFSHFAFYPKRLTIGEYIKRLILKRQTDRGSAPNTKS